MTSPLKTTAAPRLALLLLLPAVSSSAEGGRLTYLANEDVRIEGGTCDVLIDALLRDSLGDYVRHEPAVRATLETGRPPFGWRPRHVVAFHLGAGDVAPVSIIQARLPQTWVCTRPGESRAY